MWASPRNPIDQKPGTPDLRPQLLPTSTSEISEENLLKTPNQLLSRLVGKKHKELWSCWYKSATIHVFCLSFCVGFLPDVEVKFFVEVNFFANSEKKKNPTCCCACVPQMKSKLQTVNLFGAVGISGFSILEKVTKI